MQHGQYMPMRGRYRARFPARSLLLTRCSLRCQRQASRGHWAQCREYLCATHHWYSLVHQLLTRTPRLPGGPAHPAAASGGCASASASIATSPKWAGRAMSLTPPSTNKSPGTRRTRRGGAAAAQLVPPGPPSRPSWHASTRKRRAGAEPGGGGRRRHRANRRPLPGRHPRTGHPVLAGRNRTSLTRRPAAPGGVPTLPDLQQRRSGSGGHSPKPGGRLPAGPRTRTPRSSLASGGPGTRQTSRCASLSGCTAFHSVLPKRFVRWPLQRPQAGRRWWRRRRGGLSGAFGSYYRFEEPNGQQAQQPIIQQTLGRELAVLGLVGGLDVDTATVGDKAPSTAGVCSAHAGS